MATIVLSSYMVRHPLGGVIASNMQLVWGFQRLGHDVYVLEDAGYESSCFDPVRHTSGDDCRRGVAVVTEVLAAAGLHRRLCFRSIDGTYHGLGEEEVRAVLERCDLLIDRGDHRQWWDEMAGIPRRILVDPDPGYRQLKLARASAAGTPPPVHDAYYTYGFHVAEAGRSNVPRLGLPWRHIFHPVDTTRVKPRPLVPGGPFTTVMNWQSHKAIEHAGMTYGMKDVQIERFLDLPSAVGAPLEMAVEGRDVPHDRLRAHGWRIRPAVEVTRTLQTYFDYIAGSAGEFSVVKDVYRALDVGWFSDRSAAYLAMGRPVVIQDNGLDGVLPLGEGLFAVSSVDEAAAAIEAIRADPRHHSEAARAIAVDLLDTSTVLAKLLDELGLPAHGDSTERAVARS